MEIRSCRLCGTQENLTKHHILKGRSARIVLRSHRLKNRTVLLCRSCHDRFHKGEPSERQKAWDELLPHLDEYEHRLLALNPLREHWQAKLDAPR